MLTPTPSYLQSLPRDTLKYIVNKLPPADITAVRIMNKEFIDDEDLISLLTTAEKIERSEQVALVQSLSPLLNGLDIPANFHRKVVAELYEFRATLENEFRDKNVEEINSRASAWLNTELPAELEIKKEDLELAIPPVFTDEYSEYDYGMFKITVQKVEAVVMGIKCCMVQQAQMLAECNHFDMQEFDQTTVNQTRTLKVLEQFISDNERDFEKSIGASHHFYIEHTSEIVAARFSSQPVKMTEFTRQQHENDELLREKFLSELREQTQQRLDQQKQARLMQTQERLNTGNIRLDVCNLAPTPKDPAASALVIAPPRKNTCNLM